MGIVLVSMPTATPPKNRPAISMPIVMAPHCKAEPRSETMDPAAMVFFRPNLSAKILRPSQYTSSVWKGRHRWTTTTDHVDDCPEYRTPLEGADDASSNLVARIAEVLDEVWERNGGADDTRIVTEQETTYGQESRRGDGDSIATRHVRVATNYPLGTMRCRICLRIRGSS